MFWLKIQNNNIEKLLTYLLKENGLTEISLIIRTLQPHYNTIVYSMNSAIKLYRLGSHYLYFYV